VTSPGDSPSADAVAKVPDGTPSTDTPLAGTPSTDTPLAGTPSTDTPLAGTPLADTSLANGAWHHLYPATPLLRGGIFVFAVLGFVIANLRERLVDFFFGVPGYGGDPIDEIFRRGAVGWALLGVALVLIVILVGFYLSWRMHTFRVNDESVEVRSGLLFRSNRKARLDRIQGVNIVRPVIPRLFGAARLEVSVAGQDANVQLAYLKSSLADDLRRDILRLASGARRITPGTAPAAPAPPSASVHSSATERRVDADVAPAGERHTFVPEFGSAASRFATDRVHDFLSPELDPDAAPPASVVKIPPGRLIGSILLSGFTVVILVAIVAVIVSVTAGSTGWLLFAIVPGVVGSAGYYFSRITKSLRYSIAGTRDGVRVGFGLFSTSNETLPPGRIHAINVSQPVIWRPFGWWQVHINKAGHSSNQGAAGQASTTMLPVGTQADVAKVLELILPSYGGDEQRALIQRGMLGRGTLPNGDGRAGDGRAGGRDDDGRAGDGRAGGRDHDGRAGDGRAGDGRAGDTGDGFINAPRRAAWLRPFSWRRTGYAVSDGVALMRRGVVSRELILVPLARLQSVGISQGPVQRMLRLASARLHTVAGPVNASLGIVAVDESVRLFETVSAGAVTSADSDTSHRWNREPAVDGTPE
jgi:putative membrane protein